MLRNWGERDREVKGRKRMGREAKEAKAKWQGVGLGISVFGG